MMIDTGFDYHASAPVKSEGKRPDTESVAVMRCNLNGAMVRDGLGYKKQYEKWLQVDDQWFYIRGIKI